MLRQIMGLLLAGSSMLCGAQEAADSLRETFQLNTGWKFHYGDIVLPQVTSHAGNYYMVKAGAYNGPSGFQWDDSTWQVVDVPHDYVIDGKFSNKESVSHGFLPRPAAWYRRQFKLEPADRDKTVWLYFDGVGGKTTVWVNGQEMAHSHNGYVGFRVNISDVAHFGDKPNTVALRTDPSYPQGWWYEGGGIYRHVWLTKADKVHVAPFGVFANPVKQDDENWITNIETTVENENTTERTATVVSTLVDPDGRTLATEKSELTIPAFSQKAITQEIAINNPKLWDLDTPHLYKVLTRIELAGQPIDDFETTFGYRTIRFDANEGFFLNGKYTKYKGVCMHQDHAGVGVAVPDEIQEFRVARLKEMGVNAYRCSHNPPATEILKACDKLGMLVMNENRFYNSAPEYLDQLREQTLRDRNHPSVIMWSIFNEEPWQGDERGRKMAERMSNLIKQYDTSRPVCGAQNGGFNKVGAFAAADITGINYNLHQHDRVHEMFPNKHVFGSENVSHFATRGEFVTDHSKNTFDNYDEHHAGWGTGIREAWKFVDTRVWNGGMFIWTGFDYRGEPTPKAWPVISSYFGIMDTCGFAKDSFYLCQALWTDEPMAYVFPHWTHDKSMVGKEIKVGVYTNGDEAELILNGKSLGRHKVDKYDQLFVPVKYAPGKLEVKAYKNGEFHASHFVETVGAPVALGVEAKFGEWERTSVESGRRDTLPIAVYAVDAEGRRVPTASNKVSFFVEGGKVLGVGNGDPVCHEPDRASSRSLFNGLASAIIEVGNTDTFKVTVRAADLKPATLELPITKATKFIAQYPSLSNDIIIGNFRMAALTAERQDPNRTIADNDMNTWEEVMIGTGPQPHFAEATGYTTYRQTLPMPGGDHNWMLDFAGVGGKAELYVNGEKVAEKTSAGEGAMSTRLSQEAGELLTISLLVQGLDKNSGITRTVRIRQLPGKKRPGREPKLQESQLLNKGTFQNTRDWQTISFPEKTVRYITLETLNSHGNRNFGHIAELRFTTPTGEIAPKDIKIHFVSSEEVVGEDAKAENLFDGKNNTFWHSQWKNGEPSHPHRLVFDLGKEVKVSGLKYLGRQGDQPGKIKDFKVYGSNEPFQK